jgi:DNA-binding winged helix-turn-helix (wHTH) protein/Flp pilus assembly protein TadD
MKRDASNAFAEKEGRSEMNQKAHIEGGRRVYEFGPFRADELERLLLRGDRAVALSSKTLDVLLMLLRNSGHLVEKSELMREVWADSFVEDNNVAVTISMLRKALEDDGPVHQYIQTVAKRGYRFIFPVRDIGESPRPEPSRSALIATFSEEDIAERILQLLRSGRAGHVIPHIAHRRSANEKANQLYLEGRYFWNKKTERGLLRSIDCFRKAEVEDPQYAMAYAGLADAYALLASYGVVSVEYALPTAKAAALKALQLEPSLAEAYTSLGMISFYYEWNWQDAEKQFRRAIELNPDYPFAHTWYAVSLAANDRCDEAIEQVQRARELDTLSLNTNTELGRVYYLSRKYKDAIRAFSRAIDLDPHFARARARLGTTYAAQGNFPAAICEFRRAEELAGQDPYLDGLLGYCIASIGDTDTARIILETLTKSRQDRFVPSYSVALIYTGMKDHDRAIEWLVRSYEDRSCHLVFAQKDPLLDPLRLDTRFGSLLERMGLA